MEMEGRMLTTKEAQAELCRRAPGRWSSTNPVTVRGMFKHGVWITAKDAAELKIADERVIDTARNRVLVKVGVQPGNEIFFSSYDIDIMARRIGRGRPAGAVAVSCPHCGASNSRASLTCRRCGNALRGEGRPRSKD